MFGLGAAVIAELFSDRAPYGIGSSKESVLKQNIISTNRLGSAGGGHHERGLASEGTTYVHRAGMFKI